ncbi:YitT family protein [Curtobacterium sp. Leaf261]|uniref:YitT family protein n=1 Tax=Curtobacterium sp. Leaf261 TaxID=1736311 RepID=UPI0006F1F5B9|nr:YitT family protein [Curtobacterium sp. Leaf261]KQO63931.1 hypothetical protein ASF23_06450 [Curtobacterium sp. Leaf261]
MTIDSGTLDRGGDTPATAAPTTVVRTHSWLDDVTGLATGVFVASFGLHLLAAGGVVTGGTAGLSLLLSYATHVPFGVVFLVVNTPFFVLAAFRKGWSFTIRTAICVAAVSGMSTLQGVWMPDLALSPVFAAGAGSLLAGIGLLILFRHRASLGGFNIVALLVQERTGIRAGAVQMALDVVVVAASLAVVSPFAVLVSAGGAVLLNLVLVINHRPDRYVGA